MPENTVQRDLPPNPWRQRPIAVVLLAFGLALGGLIVYRVVTTEYVERRDTACEMNIMNIGTALSMRSDDYPERLEGLLPGPLRSLPTCPVSGRPYAYELSPRQKSADGRIVQQFTVYCAGDNHPWHWAENYPQYTSQNGLLTRAGPHSHHGRE